LEKIAAGTRPRTVNAEVARESFFQRRKPHFDPGGGILKRPKLQSKCEPVASKPVGVPVKSFNLLKAAATLIVLASVPAFAQQPIQSASSGSAVTLSATIPESLTMSLNQTSVLFAVKPGSSINAGNTGINATTTWVLDEARTAVTVYAYFDNPAAALTAGATQNIPSSSVSAAVNGKSVGSFTGAASTFSAGAGVTIFSQAITDANRHSSQVSPITLNIDLSALPELGAGTYIGTLHFRAEATI